MMLMSLETAECHLYNLILFLINNVSYILLANELRRNYKKCTINRYHIAYLHIEEMSKPAQRTLELVINSFSYIHKDDGYRVCSSTLKGRYGGKARFKNKY